MTRRVRRLVRATYLSKPADSWRPKPYSDPDGFVAWLTEPVHGTVGAPVNRWERSKWVERIDLQITFPDLSASSAAPFRSWLDNDPTALAERGAAFPGWQPTRSRVPPQRSRPGWSVLAYASAELGVGEAGRRLAKALRQVGLPTEMVGVSDTVSRQEHRHGGDIRPASSFDNSVTCVNGDQLERTWHRVGILPAAGRGSRIALWFWEVDRVPECWFPAFRLVDQVWVASEYTRAVLEQVGLAPVHRIVLPVTAPVAPTPYTRRMFGLPPDAFVFLCCYDLLSVLRRKNPLNVIEAYTAAFGPCDGAVLVLKSINGEHRGAEMAMVARAAERRPDILIRDGYQSAGQLAGMIQLSDCVVSLHRSEGYGLNLADAMAVGTPVVATGHSGNMTFMDDRSAFLVPFDQAEVGPGCEPYPPDATWVQPDLGMAAQTLRWVFDHPEDARRRGRVGQCTILQENSLAVAGARLRELVLPTTGSGGCG